ncbi:hypothetical protein RI367_008259 [Sorochytrium milnesiophthora]
MTAPAARTGHAARSSAYRDNGTSSAHSNGNDDDDFDSLDDELMFDAADLAVIDSLTQAASPLQHPLGEQPVTQAMNAQQSHMWQVQSSAYGTQLATPIPSRQIEAHTSKRHESNGEASPSATQQLRDELNEHKRNLFSKDGENSILRARLREAEGENVALSQQIQHAHRAGAEKEAQAREELGREIERLKTELAFQEHNLRQHAAARLAYRLPPPPAQLQPQPPPPHQPQPLVSIASPPLAPSSQQEYQLPQSQHSEPDALWSAPSRASGARHSIPVTPILACADRIDSLDALLRFEPASVLKKGADATRYRSVHVDLLAAMSVLSTDAGAASRAVDCLCLYMELAAQHPEKCGHVAPHALSLLDAVAAFSAAARSHLLVSLDMSLPAANSRHDAKSKAHHGINHVSTIVQVAGMLSRSVNSFYYPDKGHSSQHRPTLVQQLGLPQVYNALAHAIALLSYAVSNHLAQSSRGEQLAPIRNLSIFSIMAKSPEFLYLFKSDFPTSLHIRLVALVNQLISWRPFFDQALKLHRDSGKTIFSIAMHYLSDAYQPAQSEHSAAQLLVLREGVVQLCRTAAVLYLQEFVAYAHRSLPLLSRLISLLHSELALLYANAGEFDAMPAAELVARTRFVSAAFQLLHHLVSTASAAIADDDAMGANSVASDQPTQETNDTLPHPDILLFSGPGATRILKSWLLIVVARVLGWRNVMSQRLDLSDPLRRAVHPSERSAMSPKERARYRCRQRRPQRCATGNIPAVFDDIRPSSRDLLDMIAEAAEEEQLLQLVGVEKWS